MLLANQRLRELRYEDAAPSEPTGTESESSIRGVREVRTAKAQREPTLLDISAQERRAREATLVGVGLATPSPVASTNADDEAVSDSSTDETLPRIESTCEVTLGEMEVLAAQEATPAADSTDRLAHDEELHDDTQGEWIRFEKSFANTTIATIFCAILAFFLLPSGHDAPVPPRGLNTTKKAEIAAGEARSERSPSTAAVHANENEPATVNDVHAALPSDVAGAELNVDEPTANDLVQLETAQDLVLTEPKLVSLAAEAEKAKPRARTPEERKELRKKRREARAKREAMLAKQDDAEKRESTDKRRKPLTESTIKRTRSGGKS